MPMYFCKNCGLLLPADAAACPRCGAPRPAVPARTRPLPPPPVYYAAPEPPDAPLTTGPALGWMLLFSIPVAGLIAALVVAFAPDMRPSRRALARAWLLRALIVTAVAVVVALSLGLGVLTALTAAAEPDIPAYYF